MKITTHHIVMLGFAIIMLVILALTWKIAMSP